jgi:hypothetical protein
MPNQPKPHVTPKEKSKTAPPDPELRNEGEGSRSAARRYDDAVGNAMSDPKRVDELAKKAEAALDSPEGKELKKAEERGKKGSHR